MNLPQLSLRDLFWLILAAALGVAWWVDRSRLAESAQTLDMELTETRSRLNEAEDLLEFEGVVMGEGQTIHTTPDRAREIREARAKSQTR